MCEFKSAICLRNGDLHFNDWTDSHEDLIVMAGLRDQTVRGEMPFARVEFKPDEATDLWLPGKYKLRIDEAREPEWFDDKMKSKTEDRLRKMIERMVVKDSRPMLCGGCYILGPKANVQSLKNARVISMMPGANVGEMRGSANVGEMRGSANVGVMWESAKVGVMWGSANVGVMRESANVGEMRGSANVGVMRESANVLNDYREKKDK